MKLASYTANRPGIAGLFNRAVRWWLAIPYSHSELVFSDGMCFSCSLLDGGPRLKQIDLNPDHWDLTVVPRRFDETRARVAAELMCMQSARKPRYSLLLLVAFVMPPLMRWVGDQDEVCSTAIMRALGVRDHKRHDPFEAVLMLDESYTP